MWNLKDRPAKKAKVDQSRRPSAPHSSKSEGRVVSDGKLQLSSQQAIEYEEKKKRCYERFKARISGQTGMPESRSVDTTQTLEDNLAAAAANVASSSADCRTTMHKPHECKSDQDLLEVMERMLGRTSLPLPLRRGVLAPPMVRMRNFPAVWLEAAMRHKLISRVRSLLEKFGQLDGEPCIQQGRTVSVYATFLEHAAADEAVRMLHSVDWRSHTEVLQHDSADSQATERFSIEKINPVVIQAAQIKMMRAMSSTANAPVERCTNDIEAVAARMTASGISVSIGAQHSQTQRILGSSCENIWVGDDISHPAESSASTSHHKRAAVSVSL